MEPSLDRGASIVGSNVGHVGFRRIKGKKVWYRQNKLGHWRKLSDRQLNILIDDNPQIFLEFINTP